ncbi:MAG: acetylesterase [Treponema sp.]|jgi:S-formylglutathione hydrolase FrmB|nr:acetylesterase [Treponema sp.]
MSMILHGSIFSETLDLHTGINVLIPEKRPPGGYKLAYLLHGLHGNCGTWLANTMLPVYGKERGAIFIMPEAGRSFYADMRYGLAWFTWISEELPAICGELFHLSAERADTAVIGCSMGGYGALKCALSRPERYGFCGAISPACLFVDEALAELRKDPGAWREQDPGADAILRDLYAIFGDELRNGEGDVLLALARRAAAAPRKPAIYAACGDADSFYQENLRFGAEMEKLGLDYHFEGWSGAHDWYFFNEALKRALDRWLGPAA